MSVWFVTGAGRGLGAEITRRVLAGGHQVVAGARDPVAVRREFPNVGDGLLAVGLDVTEPDQVEAAVQAATDTFGRLDVVVNNAGRGLLTAVEEADDASVRSLYEVNVFGLLTVLRAVLPVVRAQRSGHIVNVSSVAGFVGNAGWGIYASTKFAVEGISEALAKELQPLGVGVTLAQPGYLRTDFLAAGSLAVVPPTIEDYAPTAGATRARAAAAHRTQPGDPARAADVLVRAVQSPHPPLRLPLGPDCVAAVAAKLNLVGAELELWRTQSESTDLARRAEG